MQRLYLPSRKVPSQGSSLRLREIWMCHSQCCNHVSDRNRNIYIDYLIWELQGRGTCRQIRFDLQPRILGVKSRGRFSAGHHEKCPKRPFRGVHVDKLMKKRSCGVKTSKLFRCLTLGLKKKCQVYYFKQQNFRFSRQISRDRRRVFFRLNLHVVGNQIHIRMKRDPPVVACCFWYSLRRMNVSYIMRSKTQPECFTTEPAFSFHPVQHCLTISVCNCINFNEKYTKNNKHYCISSHSALSKNVQVWLGH